jgi:hypothetical protein
MLQKIYIYITSNKGSLDIIEALTIDNKSSNVKYTKERLYVIRKNALVNHMMVPPRCKHHEMINIL